MLNWFSRKGVCWFYENVAGNLPNQTYGMWQEICPIRPMECGRKSAQSDLWNVAGNLSNQTYGRAHTLSLTPSSSSDWPDFMPHSHVTDTFPSSKPLFRTRPDQQSGGDVALTTHPRLAPRLKKE